MPLPCLKILQWLPTLLGIKYNFLTTAFWAPGDLSPTQFPQYFSIFFILLSPLQTVFETYVFFFFSFFLFLRHIKHRPASASLHLLFWEDAPLLSKQAYRVFNTQGQPQQRGAFFECIQKSHMSCQPSYLPVMTHSFLKQVLAEHLLQVRPCPRHWHFIALSQINKLSAIRKPMYLWADTHNSAKKRIGKTSNSYQSVKTILLGSTIVTGWLL